MNEETEWKVMADVLVKEAVEDAEARIADLEKALERASMGKTILRECCAKMRDWSVRIVGQVAANGKVYCEEIKPFIEDEGRLAAEVERRLEERRRREVDL